MTNPEHTLAKQWKAMGPSLQQEPYQLPFCVVSSLLLSKQNIVYSFIYLSHSTLIYPTVLYIFFSCVQKQHPIVHQAPRILCALLIMNVTDVGGTQGHTKDVLLQEQLLYVILTKRWLMSRLQALENQHCVYLARKVVSTLPDKQYQ